MNPFNTLYTGTMMVPSWDFKVTSIFFCKPLVCLQVLYYLFLLLITFIVRKIIHTF